MHLFLVLDISFQGWQAGQHSQDQLQIRDKRLIHSEYDKEYYWFSAGYE
jgi:hypothetical protein